MKNKKILIALPFIGLLASVTGLVLARVSGTQGWLLFALPLLLTVFAPVLPILSIVGLFKSKRSKGDGWTLALAIITLILTALVSASVAITLGLIFTTGVELGA